MKALYFITFLILMVVLLPFYSFGAVPYMGVNTGATLIAIYNIAALITALICYREFIFPRHYDYDDPMGGEYNRLPFQVFNMLFVSLYFVIAIHFLLINKSLYEGYANMSDDECIKRYFLSGGLSSIVQIIIASSLVVNVIYISTHARDYYLSGE